METTHDQDTMGQPLLDDKSQKTIADWVGDMVALESHIEEALDRQRDEVKDHPQASQAVQRYHDMVKANRDTLRAYQEQLGKTAGSPVKEAGSALLGKAAGMIDKMRTEGISKALRDDYTAFNLAAMGYEMLHTTALALGNQETATLVERALRTYAKAVQELNHLVPEVVIWELERDDHHVRSGVAQQSRQTFDRIWKETAV
jgi:ferritin-like metal-binding protein YciE